MITNHTQLLQSLLDKYGLKSYLEIGVQNPANNFDKIKCDDKVGCDPAFNQPGVIYPITSDEFFSNQCGLTKFDLVFIDGLHHADQVKRDFENSLRCLSDNGFIVIHDVLPENEEGTKVPRETKVWWGDVYKWAMQINKYGGIDFKTFNIDNGCMVISKDDSKKPFPSDLLLNDNFNYWQHYLQYGKELMNVTDTVEI